MFFLFGSETTGGGRSRKGGVLLGRRCGSDLSGMGRDADALVRSQQRHGVRVAIVLLAVVDAAVVAVHLG